MSVQFQSLFTIRVLHDYYNLHDKRCNDFEIEPAEDCLLLMKNLQILHKNFGNKLLTVAYASKFNNGSPPPEFILKPFIDFSEGIVFRYYLKLKNPHFSNFTAIALSLAERKRLYFSNLSKNLAGTVLSLSGSLSPFTVSKKYNPGDLVKGPDDLFYEAIRKGDGTADSKDLSNAGYWLKAASVDPFVTSGDQVTLVGNVYQYKLETPASNIIIKTFGLNRADNNLPYDSLLETVEKNFSQNQEFVSIDFSKKSPGKYRVVVNNETELFVYVDPIAVQQNVFGVIDIHHFEKVPPDFKLLTADGNIKVPEPLYTIHFKNRSVIWKYISQNGDISIADSAATPHAFLPATGLVIKSANAIGLAESPLTTLTATRIATGIQIKNLRNPEIERLAFEQEGATGFFTGNMFVKIDT